MANIYESCIQGYHNHESGIKQTLLVLGGAVIFGHGIWYLKSRYQNKLKNYPKGTIVLHQIPRAKYIPNISYHSLKIETFLRVASLPYINDLRFLRSPRGYIPWVEHNGSVIGDTQIAIEHFSKVFDVKLLDAQFSERDRAISLAFRTLIEQHLYWVVTEYRWRFCAQNPVVSLIEYPGQWFFQLFLRAYTCFYLRPRYLKQSTLQGIGKFNEPQVYQIGLADIKALSALLGGKSYMMGEQVSQIDCCAFAMLAQLLYSRDKNPYLEVIQNEFSNLVEYTERMKKKCWDGEWEKSCTALAPSRHF